MTSFSFISILFIMVSSSINNFISNMALAHNLAEALPHPLSCFFFIAAPMRQVAAQESPWYRLQKYFLALEII